MYFFTQVPRGSGVSFYRSVFLPNFSPEQMFEYGGARQFFRTDHRNHSLIYGHFKFGLHLLVPFREAKYLTMLREPIDRVISEYYHAKTPSADYTHPDWPLADSLSLSEFARLPQFRNLQTQYVAGIIPAQLNKSVPFLYNEQGMLKQALRNLEQSYCFVGTMERFDESVELFSQQENIPFKLVATKNSQAAPKTVSEIDEKTLCDLREYNSLDLELYRAATELLERKRSSRKPNATHGV